MLFFLSFLAFYVVYADISCIGILSIFGLLSGLGILKEFLLTDLLYKGCLGGFRLS